MEPAHELCLKKFVLVDTYGYHDEVWVCLREAGHAPPHYIDESDDIWKP